MPVFSIVQSKKAAADAAYSIQQENQRKTIEIAKTEADIAKKEKESELADKAIVLKEKQLDAEIRKQADANNYRVAKEAEADLIRRQKDAEAARFATEQEAAAKKYQAVMEAEARRAEADEGRGKLRKATGNCIQVLIRRCPNGETQLPSWVVIRKEGNPGN